MLYNETTKTLSESTYQALVVHKKTNAKIALKLDYFN
ncbi:hypothetical protein IOK_14825 [Yersinia enterocolitica subsp. palearctica PhRBD_Ye1]|uniref:Uncharacterized protein n=1 Tax=Yersinia enterocolitica W22703 TaxID=913028 RepID=F4N7F8_YEREN|nr:hypothetical protein IOK_14825 [Yersinia enterocolitica subsp. palearctica PhRBD_Ye1]CBX74016.1 unknown protein [Yersinia enterocolitica W22703]